MTGDMLMARFARRAGCARCGWFAAVKVGDQELKTGQCRVAPPRTSSEARWPRVERTDYCGSWTPADESAFALGEEE